MMADKTKHDDYAGIKEVASKIYKFYTGTRIPKDPHEVIALADKIKKEEALREQAEKAREYIKDIGKQRKQRERMLRREKLKKITRFFQRKK